MLKFINFDMMKKIIIALFLIGCTPKLFSQKIEFIDYGEGYRVLKNLTYYDFRDRCRDKDIGNCYGIIFPHMLKYHDGFQYLCSDFAFNLQKKNRSLANEYADVLTKLANECNTQWDRSRYDIEFAKGSRWAYQYLQLVLERFEIISEYYKELYNYQISKETEAREIAKLAQNITDSINSLPLNDSLYLKTQKELESLKGQRDKSIIQITMGYDEKIQKLEFTKQQKIDILPVENYTNNRKAITDEYNSLISKLKEERNVILKDNNVYWTEKILNIEQELVRTNLDYKGAIEGRILLAQENKRKEYIEKNNLALLREQFEEKYQIDLELVNLKINEHIKRK